jgi:hypothetical protein
MDSGLMFWLFVVSVPASAFGGKLGMASGVFVVPILTTFVYRPLRRLYLKSGSTSSRDAWPMIDMGRDAADDQQISSNISEGHVRGFWRGYQEMMGL